MAFIRPAVLATLLVCFASINNLLVRHLYAECVAPPPPCVALAESSLVFVADVLDAGEPTRKEGISVIVQEVRLRVIEAFKGVPTGQREITGAIGWNAETTLLAVGKRYLVYAIRYPDGHWGTSCSRTKPIAEIADELNQLRQCR